MSLPEQDLNVDWDDYNPNNYNESIDRHELNGIIEARIQGSNLCRIQLDNPPEAPFEIIKRIGTESNDGEIYLVKLKDTKNTNVHAVFKIIPYKNQYTETTFLNELRIGEMCSNMVKQLQCNCFPIMYTSQQYSS